MDRKNDEILFTYKWLLIVLFFGYESEADGLN
jgi:hypothetical protein